MSSQLCPRSIQVLLCAAFLSAAYPASPARAQTGACCIPGLPCSIQNEVQCALSGGVFLGDATDCDPDPCFTDGACCLSLAGGTPFCIQALPSECIGQGGTYLGALVPCVPDPCAPTGACCISDDSTDPPLNYCTQITQKDCEAALGTYLGDNTVCVNGLCEDPCVEPPLGLIGWWPLDELSGTTAADVAGLNHATAVGSPIHVAVAQVQGGIDSDPSNYFQAPGTNFNFGQGDFTIDAWVKIGANNSGEPWIVDRTFNFHFSAGPFFGSPPHLNYPCGIAFWPGAIPTGVWTHLAVTVKWNTPGGLTKYVNGVAVGTQNVCNYNINYGTTPLNIGGGTGGGDREFDEVQIFNRVLTPSEIYSIYSAGVGGKCKDSCDLPWDLPYCNNQTTNTVILTICNNSPVTHTYSWTPISVAPYSFLCTVNGPTVFSPPSGTATIPPMTCMPIPIVITKPTNLGPYDAGCYDIAVVNQDTQQVSTCSGSVWGNNLWCFTPIPDGVIAIDLGGPVNIDFEVVNESDPVGGLVYRYEVMNSDMSDTPPVVSLNGLPPGEPVIDTVALGPGESTTISVSAELLDFEPFKFYALTISADVNQDGVDEVLTSVELRAVPIAPPPICEGDANGDGTVDPLDAGYVQARFSCPMGEENDECGNADQNRDGTVDPLDVGYVLARFGPCPQG